MTFRHPLRNEWDEHRPAFERVAREPGRNGVMARAMLDLVPPLIDVLERERDRATPGEQLVDALNACAGAIIENAIESRSVVANPRAVLHGMLAAIERAVLPRVTGGSKTPHIILPGQF